MFEVEIEDGEHIYEHGHFCGECFQKCQVINCDIGPRTDPLGRPREHCIAPVSECCMAPVYRVKVYKEVGLDDPEQFPVDPREYLA